jgi:hypothetical protein
MSSSSDACVCLNECKLVPFGSFNFRNRREIDPETESGLNGVPLGLPKTKSRSAR